MNREQTPGQPTRPTRRLTWRRALALLVCELTILQPSLAAAQLAQVPLFTVTSVPPNVLLMFDDSASMQLLTLKAPAFYDTPTAPRFLGGTAPNTNPLLKINTVGYYGISGIRWHTGVATDNNMWNFGPNEVRWRSAAFNPLAYNPATQYLPWNNNGTRMANASYGGNGVTAAGQLTEWDKRSLPPGMGGGAVASKLTAPNSGNIPSGTTNRAWAAPVAGSVNYNGLAHGPAAPVTATAPVGTDLFSSTIAWTNPSCSANTPNYGWTCPAGSALAPPMDVCGVGNVGLPSASGTCCTSFTPGTPFPDTRSANRDITYGPGPDPGPYPAGSPPAMTGPGGEVCNSITHLSTTGGISLGTNCVQPPPYVAPCPGGGGELCTITPPQTCDTGSSNRWRCTYTENFMNSTPPVCATTVARVCSITSNPCTGYFPLDPTTDAKYDSGYWPGARYVVYDGPQPGTQLERNNLNNYRMIMIDRKFGWNTGTGTRDLIGTNLSDAVSKWFVVDGVTGVVGYRPDCAVLAGQDGTWCTFDQEAQNYANWFTYYRSRLFAKIGTVSEVLSALTGPEQFMRIGYGRINYFKDALNPWNVNSISDFPNPGSLPTLDSVANEGALERGVRPFTVYDPPLSATPNPDRQAVFDWLFSINGLGPTPNREALNAVGQYLTRTDSRGPWGEFPGSGSEPIADHLWCRRNFTVLGTDGEWTKLDPIGGFTPQRLLERASDWTNNPAALGVTTSMSVDGAVINGTPRTGPGTYSYQYLVANEPQITGGSGSTQSGTLTDVLHYYWSHDLRPDLRNSLDPNPSNRAFWQHMSTYVVGYGVVASMESPTIRTTFQNRNLISWPTLGLEACRQLDDNTADTALDGTRPTPCVHTVAPSGNRINDSLRAGLASAGDFYSANSPGSLRASLAAVFEDLSKEASAGTSVGISNTTIAVGEILVQSGFFTNTWEGYVQAVDAKAQIDFLNGVGLQPAPLWTVNFPVPGSRNITTSTAQTTAANFDWCSVSAAQRNDIDAVAAATPCPTAAPDIMNYLRGDTSRERRFVGGIFRDRRGATILGDIVNSSPRHSKALDNAYHLQPAASFVNAGTDGHTLYRAYVTDKKTNRWPTVMFGANDGMFHILDARVGQATSGQEIFAYVPRAVYSRLRGLADPAYTHKYTVDGPVLEGDVWNGSAWKTIVVGSTGAGPAGLFAIDISKPQLGLTATNVMWDITPADHAHADVQNFLGNTLGLGAIGSVRYDADATPATKPNGKWAFIVGNGYESASKRAALLVFDAFNGNLIRAIDTGVGNAGNPNGLGAIAPVYDGNRNIIAVYAGDKRGNLWKFDLSSDNPANWKIFNEFPVGSPKPLFAAGSNRPIFQEPRVMTHPIGGVYVVFGTGKYFEVTDPTDTADQGIFAIWDKGQLAPVTFASVAPLTLQEFTSAGETFRRIAAADLATYDWNDNGFWIQLRPPAAAANGERVIAPLLVDAGMMVVTSFAPESGTDRCVPGGTSYLYRFDLSGGFSRGAFGALGADTIGRKVSPGVFGGLSPIYEPVNAAGPVNHSMTAADVKTMLSNPKYKISGTGQAVDQDALGKCTHVGLHVTSTWARVPTNCAGILPLRAWRPLR